MGTGRQLPSMRSRPCRPRGRFRDGRLPPAIRSKAQGPQLMKAAPSLRLARAFQSFEMVAQESGVGGGVDIVPGGKQPQAESRSRLQRLAEDPGCAPIRCRGKGSCRVAAVRQGSSRRRCTDRARALDGAAGRTPRQSARGTGTGCPSPRPRSGRPRRRSCVRTGPPSGFPVGVGLGDEIEGRGKRAKQLPDRLG